MKHHSSWSSGLQRLTLAQSPGFGALCGLFLDSRIGNIPTRCFPMLRSLSRSCCSQNLGELLFQWMRVKPTHVPCRAGLRWRTTTLTCKPNFSNFAINSLRSLCTHGPITHKTVEHLRLTLVALIFLKDNPMCPKFHRSYLGLCVVYLWFNQNHIANL